MKEMRFLPSPTLYIDILDFLYISSRADSSMQRP